MGLQSRPPEVEAYEIAHDPSVAATPWAVRAGDAVIARFASEALAEACADALESARMQAGMPPPGDGWEMIRSRGFTRHAGPIWFRRDDRGLVFGFRALPKHRNSNGVIHGGMIMTFIDRILGVAIVEEAPHVQPQATIQLDTHFVSGARVGEFVEARCALTRATRAVAFATATVYVGERIVAKAQGMWKLREG
ncbi:PaaI family thioesterase [Camelimonas abortus]|uniref:PaaI family thioesterase n=1 Tax=Camelimonas abortus TaxID=1017184 RepID=A0ABV7LB65_9HYPH